MFFTKNSTPQQINSSTLYFNGTPISTAKRDGDSVSLSYNMTPTQAETYEYSEKQVLENLPNINTFLPDTLNAFSKELEAYQNAGLKTINNAYKSSETDLKNSIASRFGNLDNSSFLEGLEKINNSKADAIAELGEKVSAKNSELFDDELQRRYNYLNLLLDYQNNQFNNALNALGLSQNSLKLNGNSSSGNYNYSNQLSNLLLKSLLASL